MSAFRHFELDEGKFIDLLSKLIGECKYLQVVLHDLSGYQNSSVATLVCWQQLLPAFKGLHVC